MTQNNDRFALPQEQFPPVFVAMRDLSTHRKRYLVMPPFQRSVVWGVRQCQALIDTILQGEHVPPLEGYREFSPDGQSQWILIDGHQRTTAVLRFMDGEFKTWTPNQKQAAEPNSDAPVEPGRYFDQLSPIAKNYLLDYQFMIVQVRNKNPQQLTTRFLRINKGHVPLSAAELLNAYNSKAKDAAKLIERHWFWEDFYDGQTNREQLFQSALFLIGMETAMPKITVDLMSGRYAHALACGRRDHLITAELKEAVMSKIDKMALLYHGAHFTQRSVIVAMYQSIQYLENAGYTITQADRGKLTPWLMGVIAESKRVGTPNYAKWIQQMLRESTQKEFWDRHLRSILATFDIGLEAIVS